MILSSAVFTLSFVSTYFHLWALVSTARQLRSEKLSFEFLIRAGRPVLDPGGILLVYHQ